MALPYRVTYATVCAVAVVAAAAGVAACLLLFPDPALRGLLLVVVAASAATHTTLVAARVGLRLSQPAPERITLGGWEIEYRVVSTPSGRARGEAAEELGRVLAERVVAGAVRPTLPASQVSSPDVAASGAVSDWRPETRSDRNLAHAAGPDYVWKPGICEKSGRYALETRQCLLPGEDGKFQVVRLSRAAMTDDFSLHALVAATEEAHRAGKLRHDPTELDRVPFGSAPAKRSKPPRSTDETMETGTADAEDLSAAMAAVCRPRGLRQRAEDAPG